MDLATNIATASISLVITAMLGFIVIPMLRKLKYGQTILDIGPAWHKDTKQGTPTMGGVMFIAGTLIGFGAGLWLLWQKDLISFEPPYSVNFFMSVSGIIMALFFAFVGFLDDYIKVRKKRNEGLTANQKIIFQVMIISAYFTVRVMSGNTSTVINIPVIGIQIELWYFYYLIMGLVILYLVNAVNLTDGIDGLCGSVSLVYFAAFMVVCSILEYTELSVLSVAAAGGCLGFLIWNFYPAKVFMGDTGSMFLGGLVCALGVGAGAEVIMIIAAAVYIWEALTVLIQMVYFKLTNGKRLFKMTPIHHSFELRGWKEVKIVMVFSMLAAMAGILAIWLTMRYAFT